MIKLLAFISSIILSINSIACTAVNIKAKDNTIVAGRTMEWAFNMNWKLLYYPKNFSYQITAPKESNLPPIKVENKYAVFGIGTGIGSNAILDGQNSAGLGISFNFLPGFTKFQTVEPTDKNYVSVLELGRFILGNYATVQEIRKKLPSFKVWEESIPNLPVSPTIHIMATDKTGDAVIIEFINGEMKFFETNTQVMTNAPTYDWHEINIHNYLNLNNEAPYTSTGLKTFSEGSGSFGLPGSYTSDARFIRAVFLKHYALEPQNAYEAVNLVGHILNNVDIISGIINTPAKVYETTQWVVLKDLTNDMLYFTDYNNRLNYISINLKNIFSKEKYIELPIEKIEYPKAEYKFGEI